MDRNEDFDDIDISQEIEQINNEEKYRQEKEEYEETPRRKKRPKGLIPKIIFGFLGLLLIIFSGFYFFSPTLKLEGDDTITIEYNNKYKDPGYKATYLGKDITDKVYTNSNVDFNKIGEYVIKYMVRKNRIVITRTRKVKIVDSAKPEITLTGEAKQIICPNKEYTEEGYAATDNYDGDLTNKVKIDKKDNKIIYVVEDSSGNKASVEREFEKKDTEAPVITLKSGSNTSVVLGGTFKEPGYTATDNCDDDLTDKVEVSGKVDTSKTGTYELTYKVRDSSGNEGTITRKVTVYTKAVSSLGCGEPGVIYLTLDDGPSGYTKTFLDIFDKYNVKVTFFVTNQFPKYQNMIGEEHRRGHKVALHTYTHDSKWSFYYGVDKYFADFDKMNAVIEKQTGSKTKLFRFPGGASNTVSCHRGGSDIMTRIVQEATNRGYTYFDWNISSGDAGGTTDPNQVYKNVVNSLRKDRGNVVLMHDIHRHTLNAIERIVKYGVDNGYTFKTLDTSVVCKQKLAC